MASVGLVLVSLTPYVKARSVFLCLLNRIPRVGLYSCVSYTVLQGLVCVLGSLTPYGKGWSVFLCLLHRMARPGLFSCVS